MALRYVGQMGRSIPFVSPLEGRPLASHSTYESVTLIQGKLVATRTLSFFGVDTWQSLEHCWLLCQNVVTARILNVWSR